MSQTPLTSDKAGSAAKADNAAKKETAPSAQSSKPQGAPKAKEPILNKVAEKTPPSPQPKPVEPPKPKKPKKGFGFKRMLLIVIVVVAIVGGAFSYYHYQYMRSTDMDQPVAAATSGQEAGAVNGDSSQAAPAAPAADEAASKADAQAQNADEANAPAAPVANEAASKADAQAQNTDEASAPAAPAANEAASKADAQTQNTDEASAPAAPVANEAASTQDTTQLQQIVTQQQAALASAQDALTTQQNSITQLTDQLATLSAQLDTAQQQIRTLSKQLAVTMRQSKNQPAQTAKLQLLSEVGSLLRIAQRQLVLGHDANSALNALNLAQSMLQARGISAQFQPLLEAIGDQITQLKNRANLSLGVLDQTLQTLSLQFERMNPGYLDRLAGQRAAASEDAPKADNTQKGNAFVGWLKDSLSGLVTVEKLSNSNLAYMNQAQADTIRDSVAMNLLIAQKALQLGDTALWKSSLSRLQNLLTHFYDHEDPEFASVQDSLRQLINKPITVPLPDMKGVMSVYEQLRAALTGE